MRMRTLTGAIAVVLALTSFPALADPRSFASPDEAVSEVIDALHARDRDGLIAIFGKENEDVVLSGDPERDRSDWGAFLMSYEEMHRLATDTDGRTTLYVGRSQWPFPITLVKGADGRWSFDLASARDEILDRRIGRNELDVIKLMHGYVRVQARFRQTDYDGDGVMEFASSIISSPGAHDGLYWPSEAGQPESPIGDFVARATAIGYKIDGQDEPPDPYLGYYFKILQKQGPHAPGGEMSYMVNGNMVAGHALLAFPADYGDTGVMSFMVGENGIVYEADLGENTLDVASKIDSFDPGDPWKPAE